MNVHFWIPVLIPLIAAVTGAVIFCLKEENAGWRTGLNMASAIAKVALVAHLVWGVFHEQTYRFEMPLFQGFKLVLEADSLSLLFVSLSSTLWLVTTVYAIGYLEHSPNRSRFFGFFSLCVSATSGIALAGNLFTFLIFYEFLTLTTYPLVVHRGTRQALEAGRVYLIYTFGAGTVLLAAMVWLSSLVGMVNFVEGGLLHTRLGEHDTMLKIVFWMLIAGFGVKSGLVPLHGWLPSAMVAPAPVSALLHAVAVVKAGAFGILRVVNDVYGVDAIRQLGLGEILVWVAGATILYGSLRALAQDDFKRRLAYSTVSQVSYVTLGAALAGPLATVGGIVHLVHQGIMKITLFFCAGNAAEELHIHRISELNGVGRRMPWTMAAFTVAALGMIGVPPTAGFVSKWYLGWGALEVGAWPVVALLLTSSALNAAYFLPILYALWFREPDGDWAATPHRGREIHWALLAPPVITAGMALLAGLLAASPFSPLAWAKLITAREYGL